MKLRQSLPAELPVFANMEIQAHAKMFVNQLSIPEHRAEFESAEVVYLTVVANPDIVAGFFVLSIDDDHESVEFRRLVIDQRHRGIGQKAIRQMEDYCRVTLKRSRVWLDVYEDNAIGIHVYEKLGYLYERTGQFNERSIRFYSKRVF